MDDTYIVYIRIDGQSRVLEINSSAFLADTAGWTQIDEGWGNKYHHALGNYLDGPLYDDNGIPRYKLDRGRVVERTEEEIAADLAAMPEPEPGPQEQMQAAVRLARMQAQSLPDAQALEVLELYDLWAADTAYTEQYIVHRPGGQLYRCQQAHTSQEGWEPENTPALWVVIANAEAGTAEDPITAARGMEYQYGLYYRDPEDNLVYLCERTGEEEGGKIVLQYLPHEVVGQYFTEVTG